MLKVSILKMYILTNQSGILEKIKAFSLLLIDMLIHSMRDVLRQNMVGKDYRTRC